MEIRPIATKAISTLNAVGSYTTQRVVEAKDFVQNEISQRADKIDFVHNAKQNNISKDTFIGAGVVIAAGVLAFKCLKGITKAVKNLKKDI